MRNKIIKTVSHCKNIADNELHKKIVGNAQMFRNAQKFKFQKTQQVFH